MVMTMAMAMVEAVIVLIETILGNRPLAKTTKTLTIIQKSYLSVSETQDKHLFESKFLLLTYLTPFPSLSFHHT